MAKTADICQKNQKMQWNKTVLILGGGKKEDI